MYGVHRVKTEVETYFEKQMEKISVQRAEYGVVETFEGYLAHRYKTSCYFYSAFAIMGMKNDDKLVRAEIRLPEDDWMWKDGGYDHAWVEFCYKGQEYVFDCRCVGIVLKSSWYEHFQPENPEKIAKQQILEKLLSLQGTTIGDDGSYQIPELNESGDVSNQIKPLRKSILYMENGDVKKFIAYRNPLA